MPELMVVDLKPLPSSYESDRQIFNALAGEDTTKSLLLELLNSDVATTRALISRSSEILLEEQHIIYSEDRPSKGPGDFRRVSARPELNLAHAMVILALGGRTSAISALLEFATEHKIAVSEVITRDALKQAIKLDHAAVVEIFMTADPALLDSGDAKMGTNPLYEAVRFNRLKVARTLLQLGASVECPAALGKGLHPVYHSLLAKAALESPEMVELLLEYGVVIAGTGALHGAVSTNHLDAARVLLAHGADINERLVDAASGWTPMHFAYRYECREGIEFLERLGARSDLRDSDGNTPAQVETLESVRKADQEKRDAASRADSAAA